MTLREEILALADRAVVEVAVPEWGGRTLRLAALSAADRDAYELERFEQRKAGGLPVNVRAALVGRCVVDENMQRVFTEADLVALGQKNGKALDRLYDAALRLNVYTEAEQKAIEGN